MNRVLPAALFILTVLGIVLMAKSASMMYTYFAVGLILHGCGCCTMSLGKGSASALCEGRDETRNLEK